MAISGWLQIYILQLSILLSVQYTYAQTERQCVQGLKTMGYTEPCGDILIEYGNPLDITCVLNDEYVLEKNTSNRLYFEKGGVPLPSEMIETLNSSSISIHVEKPPTSSSVYTCKLKDASGVVCLNNVIVGTKPLPVTDFECISYNYENLTCTWTRPENYVKTSYNLTYFFPGRAGRRARKECPNLVSYSENKMGCLWTIISTPPYRQAQRTFYFELNMTNFFGTTILNKTFSHFQHVLSDPPGNLTAINVTSESIFLHWSIPNAMQAFPPGLQHRIMYQSEYGDKHWQYGGMETTSGNDMKNVHFNLTGLTYAHALYDIRVSMRSTAAAPDDETMWSKNASITVRTKSKRPGAPPQTNIGSFEIVSAGTSLNNTDMYVYWQQIPEYIKNGERFSYHIAVQGSARIFEPEVVTNAYAKFTNLSAADSYTFRIWSQNGAGRSERESIVHVPKESERIGEPLSFTKIAFGNGKYELSWEPPKKRPVYAAAVKNYTIFWCTHERDRPYQCSGYLNWTEISHHKTVYNITVSENVIHQFAISANSETSSSGMVWATCTVIHNKAIGKMETVYIVHVGATFIEIAWKLDCSDRIGSVKGFVVYYCSIVSPTVTSCKEPEKNLTIYGDSSTNQANITNLNPYQTYMLAVAVMTKHTTQSQKSTYLYATTLEEAPSSPPVNVHIANVTNSSVTIVWDKPPVTNGQLKNYKILCNNGVFDVSAHLGEYTIPNLLSYTEYNISVEACTVKCSKPSAMQRIQTKGGYPSKIAQPGVVFQNGSLIVVEWGRPQFPRGNNNVYEVNFKEKLPNENRTAGIVNTTGTRYEIRECGADGKYNSFYISVRAINIFDDVRYEGPWSDELEAYCRTSHNSWLWALIPICFIIVLGLFYMAKKMYFHCREMRDVDIKLPPGLAPVITTDIGLSQWGGPKLPEEQSHHSSADEELLLVKMSDTRTLSGDSSGCSSGHESVGSGSLESGTHLSGTSDSGTEQPRTSSNEDFQKNSLRLRNVATRPALTKGYVTMPTDGVNTSTWTPKAPAPGSYCVLGVDPTPVTSINPNYVPVTQPEPTKLPYSLPDASTQSTPYVITGNLPKPSNSGYVPLNSPELVDKSPPYVMAGNKGIVVPDIMRLDSVKSADVEQKSAYVQVADVASTMRKTTPETFVRHQPSIDTSPPKIGYVSIGDAPGPRACADSTKGYIPHRHFETKTLKED